MALLVKRGSHALRGQARKTESGDPNIASASPSYLQLKLALYNRSGLTTRIHLRFAEGDDSYNYIQAGQAYIGLFRDPKLAENAKTFVRDECKKLSGVLEKVSLAAATLRAEDSAAFVENLLTGCIGIGDAAVAGAAKPK